MLLDGGGQPMVAGLVSDPECLLGRGDRVVRIVNEQGVARSAIGIVVDELLADSLDRPGGRMHEFGDVGGPIGSGELREYHGRAAATLFINMGQEKLHPVVGSPLQRLRFPSLAPVERNPVQIEQELLAPGELPGAK